MDYSETGGAPLLGVRGVSVICHGKSSERAIMNAVNDALKEIGAELLVSPITPRRIFEAISKARGAGT